MARGEFASGEELFALNDSDTERVREEIP